jgi:hypothetical protein
MTDMLELLVAFDERELTEDERAELAQVIVDTRLDRSRGCYGRFLRDMIEEGWRPDGATLAD